MRLSQIWGENPQDYLPMGIPAHNGLDTPIPTGTPVFSTVHGTVTRLTTTGNYGNRVAVQTTKDGLTYELTFAHLQTFNVSVGQTVQPNTIVGYSGNTGFSTGPHLHFGVRVLNRTYTDSFGVWPNNHHNPMLWLAELYSRQITGISGYLYLPSLKVDDTSNIGYTKGNMNLREQPSVNSRLLGVVPTGDAIEILNTNPTNNYVLCRTQLQNVPPPPSDYVYNGPPVTYRPLLESPADDWRWPTVKGMIDYVGIGVKFKSHGVNADYYNSYSQNHNFLPVRLFVNLTNYIPPETLYNDTWKGQIQNFYNRGARDFELFNEPNIEGVGVFWNNGTEYANYMKVICQMIKTDFPSARLWFTAMSPGVPFTNQYTWIDAAWPILKPYCYGFCTHAYSGDNVNVTNAANDILSQIQATRVRYNLQVPLFLSEVSVNRGSNYNQKAQVYQRLDTELAKLPGIIAASYFISDWYSPPPSQQDHGESWYGTDLPTFYKTL